MLQVLDQYLHLCGGERAMKIGLGDDDDSIEEDFNKWTEAALELLKESGVVGKCVHMPKRKQMTHLHPPFGILRASRN